MAGAGMIVVDTTELRRLARALRASGPVGAAAVRGAMRDGGKIVAADAQGRASFSTRIPQTVKARGSAANFKVSAGGEAAPNAAPIENEGKGFVRHPTYSPRPGVGERVGWTEKNSHPAFLHTALAANAEVVAELVADRLETAVTDVIGGR
jgi:hypothetical protein